MHTNAPVVRQVPDRAITPLAYSVAEAVAALGLSRSQIFKLMRSGKLQRTKVGRRTLISVASLMALIDQAD
ncbi:hypothetical protein CHU93_16780 [Sandarakinorhabdus cyanobacteriorum]|uniref:Helix-turn-helix domain-containing protein n=1 Tax=Sandarakinorhabdus cyanobacteriorum TaxID=1981098 RepID=A0A255Y5F8_9SPHN|nr:helix-turn-helix domain-containing protein [Sandarakinorhabdus cyanobacteriorum]OYQ23904.1 hypothetical protein CHU93_16780 [Sandarakinorhabdus cyanobacteriorum]